MSWVFLVETLQVTQETGKVFLAENMGESSSPPPWKKKNNKASFVGGVFLFKKFPFRQKTWEHPPAHPPVLPLDQRWCHRSPFVLGACRYISTGGLDGTLSSGYTFKTFGTLGHIRSLGERLFGGIQGDAVKGFVREKAIHLDATHLIPFWLVMCTVGIF